MPFDLNSRVRDIINNEQARAVLNKHVPGATAHPDLPMAMHMTLREVASYPEAGISQTALEALVRDLKKLP